MNLPNKLTILRVALIVPFVFFMTLDAVWAQFLAALVFLLASVTDLIDGWYARRYDMVTDFGKLMDPMADKLLVMAALVVLVAQGRAPWLAAVLALGREFVVSGVRLVAAAKGIVVAADKLGKVKTVLQMIAIPMLLLSWALPSLLRPGEILLWASVALSVLSCAQYIWNVREVFKS